MGSRGDVQPYLALCVELQRSGHQMRLATHGEFAPLIREYGIAFHDMGSDPRALLETELAREMLASGKNPFRFLRTYGQLITPIIERSAEEGQRAVAGAEGIIQGNFGLMANRLTPLPVPGCAVCLQPFTPTSSRPSPFFPEIPGGRLGYNLLTHHLFYAIFWQIMGRPLSRAQRKLGLPLPDARASRAAWRRQLVCHAYSPALLPPPREMPGNHHVTGFCFLDHAPDWRPPPALEAFLAAGPPPVYIGFGSMRNERPEETAELVIAALQRAGQRGVLLRGWGGLQQGDVPGDMLLIDAVPHDWLFPRMCAVAHHGGAGTTAAGLRAGVPSIIIPYFADQPFWARTAYHAGVSPPPIPRAQLSAERLAAAIRVAVTDQPMRARAAELGRRIEAEHGTQMAARMIEEYLLT